MKKLAVWPFEKRGVMTVGGACRMYYEKADCACAGQDMIHVGNYLHFPMVVRVAPVQKAALWLFEHEDWTMLLSCLDILHLKNWKLENFDAGRLRHDTWKSKDQSHD